METDCHTTGGRGWKCRLLYVDLRPPSLEVLRNGGVFATFSSKANGMQPALLQTMVVHNRAAAHTNWQVPNFSEAGTSLGIPC